RFSLRLQSHYMGPLQPGSVRHTLIAHRCTPEHDPNYALAQSRMHMQDTHAEYTYGKQPGLLWAELDIYYGRNIAQRALQMGKGRGQLPGQPEPVQEKVDGDHRKAMLQRVVATRYITPLREGGSLPALIEADDGDEYVVKFCGAGQGVKALVAELVAGEIARKL